MTVAELIAILAALPPSAEVIFHDEEIGIHQGHDLLAQIDESGILMGPSR